ncbi:hypothetical protein AEST_15570 [Alishewanella aestuarii B11]|uniref:Uncharacterized protein n=1 Tax=Alishewanella aestuarii B11 TaxID=1197174 RepID=J1QJA6_9ALTE|nr:hypothetical protein AEST_15570 [Alishewanella aestuarii B11]
MSIVVIFAASASFFENYFAIAATVGGTVPLLVNYRAVMFSLQLALAVAEPSSIRIAATGCCASLL